MLLGSFAYPPEADARLSMRKFGRFLGRSARFIVTLPDRATHKLGPVLGPVASFMLTKNIMKNPRLSKVFRHASRANKVLTKAEDIQKRLAEVRKAYRNEASKLRVRANELTEQRKQLAKDLLKGGDFGEYKTKVADMQKLIELNNQAADNFDNAANHLGTNDVIKMMGKDFLAKTWLDTRNAVLIETSKEISKVTDPNILVDLLKGGGTKSVVDFLVDREMRKSLPDNKEGFDKDALRENVRKRVNEELKKNKSYLKDNWEEKINEIIKEQTAEMEKEKARLKESENKIIKEETTKKEITKETEKKQDEEFFKTMLDDKELSALEDFEKSLNKALDEDKELVKKGEVAETPAGKCPSGYVYRPSWGVDCVQVNCTSVANAHYSSTGHCICGSAGSIAENPKDPNKICMFSQSYSSCPSCVYACIHLEEECTLKDTGF